MRFSLTSVLYSLYIAFLFFCHASEESVYFFQLTSEGTVYLTTYYKLACYFISIAQNFVRSHTFHPAKGFLNSGEQIYVVPFPVILFPITLSARKIRFTRQLNLLS